MKILWIFLAMVAGTTEGFAGEHPSSAQVRAWVAEGNILSLENILEMRPLPGRLLDAELEWEGPDDHKDRDKGNQGSKCLVYELKWIDGNGRRHEQYVNARTGTWLDEEDLETMEGACE